MLKDIRHLDYVVLICDDPGRMRRFYQDVFGFEVYRELPEHQWVELRVGSVLLALRPRWPGEGEHAPGSASVQLAFRVTPAQVTECFEELRRKNVTITDPPRDQPWGHRTLFFRDPENNVLEIYADL
jgi:catechol 2,3-dioxygenase-like lactoylglutathione lyase family enzyme